MNVNTLAQSISDHGTLVATAVSDPAELVEVLATMTRPHRIRPDQRGAVLNAYAESVVSMSLAFVNLTYGADVDVIPDDVDPDTHLFPITRSGTARLTYGNESLSIVGPSATVISPYRPFRSQIRADHHQVIMAVRRSRIEAIAARLVGADTPGPVEVPLASFDVPPAVLALLDADILLASDGFGASHAALLAKMDDVVIEAMMLAMPGFRSRLPEPTTVSSRRLREAMVYMEGHLTEPLTISEVARHVGVTSRSLQLSFRRETGETPIGWLKARRLDHAHALLTSDPPPRVSDAARASGFHHLGDFAAAFKDRFGESPSAVRRRAGAGPDT